MKNKANKLAVALLAVFCLAVPVFVGNMETKAADGDTTYVTEPYTVEKAKKYFTNDEAPTCETTGYIFAGWYERLTVAETSSTGAEYFTEDPLTTLTGYTGEEVTALFVDEAVLGVKGQIAIMDDDTDTKVANMTEDTEVNIRLVTSVDTLKYQQVGVKVSYTYNGDEREKENATKTVYKQLIVADGNGEEDDKMKEPSEVFSKRSQYFKPCTITGIPADAYEMIFYARAFWITADGATVYGSSTPVEKTVQQGLYHTYEASVGTEDTTEAYYKVLETAVANANTKTVTLLKDAEVSEDMVISGNVKITNRKGANVTIYRASGLTSGNVLSVESGATLNIVGTKNENSIVLDGRTTNGVEVSGDSLIDVSASTLFIYNATIKNATNLTNNDGGALHIAANSAATVENSKFIANSAKYGAAIRVGKNTTVTITNCVFGEEGSGNEVTTQGGAIYSQCPNMEVVDSQFLYNNSGARGGAVYLNYDKAPVAFNAKNTKFANNKATTSGGAIYNAGGVVTLTAENDEKNSSLAVFEYNVSKDTTKEMGGGAILTGNATGALDITGYTFRYNEATKTGGAICARNGKVTIKDAQFIGNYTTGASGYGGAVAYAYASAAEFTITGTTFTGNYTQGSAAHGGAVYVADSTKTTVNTDITTVNTYEGNHVAEGSTNSSDGTDKGVYIAK